MGAANSVNCYQRWGRRAPDGPLIKDFSFRSSGSTAAASGASMYATNAEAAKPEHKLPENGEAAAALAEEPKTQKRSSRRRPTALASQRTAGDASDTDGQVASESDSGGSDRATVADTMAARVVKLRKQLTCEVRLKTHFSSTAVKVTIDDEGDNLQWFAPKKEEKGPLGGVEVTQIMKVHQSKTSAKAVELTAKIASGGTETLQLTFTGDHAARAWVKSMKNLQTLKQMA
eukprot:Selendium_serpulae@DN6283_c3_g7_i1.p3